MANKMLIDATHAEETRVVVLRGDRVEEFDLESADRKQLRGNIYLAKVTRVEPSLQAAFVDYGGNRHGFLAFNEIHPDYYQIPLADRQALLEESGKSANGNGNGDSAADDANGEAGDSDDGDDDQVEQVGAEDALEEVPVRQVNPRPRRYKIQEVIKRRQILLIQVVKEERGQKGAALTTYLSLAGRYSVLMPNTARGGGISRKIINSGDRRRLKTIAGELPVPQGMGVIVRTAGANRTKVEIKRDFDYLIRLWEDIRALTLQSTAPSLIYEEGSLIKRSIRDLYSKEIESVLIDGEAAYKEAKAFMRMLMPSHSKNVKQYKDAQPLFVRHRVESQLHQMFSPNVTLPSGGYLVINQTEALVAIDVNSGKSTREHSIEDTARKTNLEAAEEVARQLRLRDLAGLVVIDFIDMDEKRNNRAVEQRLKECLKTDRARIQVGRISHFGLMEMSRQRIRASVIEGTMDNCPVCQGTGRIRSISSTTLQIMREIEEVANTAKKRNLTVNTPAEIALYLLNQKRGHLHDLGARFGIAINVHVDAEMLGSAYSITRGEINDSVDAVEATPVIQIDSVFSEQTDAPAEQQTEEAPPASEGAPRRRRRRSRGRRRGSDNTGATPQANPDQAETEQSGQEATTEASANPESQPGNDSDEKPSGRPARRRGRRGGRRQNRSGDKAAVAQPLDDAVENVATEGTVETTSIEATASAASEQPAQTDDTEAPKPARRRRRARKADTVESAPEAVVEPTVEASPSAGEAEADGQEPEVAVKKKPKPRKPRAVKAKKPAAKKPTNGADQPLANGEGVEAATVAPIQLAKETVAAEQASEPAKPARKGWWRR